MSDEQQPPPLRLRPRKRDDAPVPVVVPVADASPGRFRLKPKLAPGSEELTMNSDSAAATPVQSADENVGSAPRLKLKVTGSAASDQPLESMPAADVVPPVFVSPMAPDAMMAAAEIGAVSAPEDLSALLIIPGPPPLIVAAESPVETVISPMAPVAPPVLGVKTLKPKATANAPSRLLLALLALVVLGGGAGTWFFVIHEEPPAPPPVVQRPAAVPVPKVASTPPVGAPPAPANVFTPESLGLDPLPDATGTQATAALVAAKPIKAPVVPVMTPAFRLWLEGVRINGVTVSAGAVPRVIINGRLVRPGDTIDSTEGIVFESVDVERKCILFRNRAGFVAPKPY